jgi:hypothetical protein
MFPSKATTFLALSLASLIPSTSAAAAACNASDPNLNSHGNPPSTDGVIGCYPSGLEFDRLGGNSDVRDAISQFCTYYRTPTFEAGYKIGRCYAYPGLGGSGSHMDLVVMNRDYQARVITFEQCYCAFVGERDKCPRGSESMHGDFWYRIDPSEGACEGGGDA